MLDVHLTPMMRQYQEAKAKHPHAVLLFRMGDFYEMFFEDAVKVSKILDLALTSRDKNKEEGVPMCGFPHHAASSYISRLLAAGERVAICDQIEDPRKAKGIVKREVTRVLTPGLTDDPGSIKADENNFVVALTFYRDSIGIAAFDLSTGDLRVTATPQTTLAAQELRRLEPSEVLLPPGLPAEHPLRSLVDDSLYVQELEDWLYDPRTCVEVLLDQYGVQNLRGFGLDEHSPQTLAVGSLIYYVRQMRSERATHIKPPRSYHLGAFMVLDQATLRNLEIFRNTRDGTSTGTLIALLDRTCTPMGARLLRNWIAYPLLDVEEIEARNRTVAQLVSVAPLRTELREILQDMGDIERIAGKISLKTATPRDLVQLRYSAELLPGIIHLLEGLDAPMASSLREMDDLAYVAHAIGAVLVDNPPATLKEGGVIREGYSGELDELRAISRSGKEWIAGIEARERERSGIANLKVGYNRVFGYFIEVSKSQQNKVPDHYIRKQTLVNAERYVTEELKEYELKVLNAQDRMLELEEEIYQRLRANLVEVIPRIQATAAAVATLDVLLALAETAHRGGYVVPRVHTGDEIVIKDGRHPVVETFEQREAFVPNDVLLNRTTDQLLIITGPNMAGKSTYLRQTALMVIMAQIGSLIPATEASIGLVDRIFTRIGAADYLAFGQSTFMVEMTETAEILHNATERSLVLLDEVGRGTSTFDGLSIAWAVTEYLHDHPNGGPRTLFATHYHELVEIATLKRKVRNYNIALRESPEGIVFLRKIVPGGCSRSYGIQVAKLAGIPQQVVSRAQEILAGLERKRPELRVVSRHDHSHEQRRKKEMVQGELFSAPHNIVIDELKRIDPNQTTPLEALTTLVRWKQLISS